MTIKQLEDTRKFGLWENGLGKVSEHDVIHLGSLLKQNSILEWENQIVGGQIKCRMAK